MGTLQRWNATFTHRRPSSDVSIHVAKCLPVNTSVQVHVENVDKGAYMNLAEKSAHEYCSVGIHVLETVVKIVLPVQSSVDILAHMDPAVTSVKAVVILAPINVNGNAFIMSAQETAGKCAIDQGATKNVHSPCAVVTPVLVCVGNPVQAYVANASVRKSLSLKFPSSLAMSMKKTPNLYF